MDSKEDAVRVPEDRNEQESNTYIFVYKHRASHDHAYKQVDNAKNECNWDEGEQGPEPEGARHQRQRL